MWFYQMVVTEKERTEALPQGEAEKLLNMATDVGLDR